MLTTAVKSDGEKPRMDLIPTEALVGLAQVLTFGAKKYRVHNWRLGMDWSRLVAAAMRHLTDFNQGMDVDPDSGLLTIDHALCCLAFLSAYQHSKLGTDDRWKLSPNHDLQFAPARPASRPSPRRKKPRPHRGHVR